jgi:Ca2+-binding RTX toxin-like protein
MDQGMKRLLLTAIAILVTAACTAPIASAAERSVTVLLNAGPGTDVFDVKLSQDGRSYLVDSLYPLEAGGGICVSEEGSIHDLTCEAAAIGGFEVNAGSGDDSVIISPKILVPATLRGGPGDDRMRGGGGPDKLIGGPGADILYGHGGNDWIFGGSGDDWLYGLSGDDRLVGGPGGDYLNGGPGTNEVNFGPGDRAQLEP